MNGKQFGILLALVVVLGGAGLMLYKNSSSSWTGGGTAVGQKLLGEFDVNTVAQIAIKHGPTELLVAKKNDLWRVAQRGDYPANFSEISSLLLKLKDMKVVQTETVGASQLPRLELVASGTNAPTNVEFRDASGKALKTLVLGKRHMQKRAGGSPMGDMDDGGFADGRYVQVGGASEKVLLVSDELKQLEPNADTWLSKDFFKIEKAKAIAVTFPIATNSWKLVRETEGADLKLVDVKPGEELDSAKASGVANPLSSPSFADVAVGVTPEASGLDKPTVINVETLDGFAYTVKVGAKTNDNFYLTMSVSANFVKERTPGKDEKPEDKTKLDKEFADKLKKLEEKLATEKAYEPWTYLVASWTVDSIIKERSHFMVEKKDEAKKEAGKEDPALAPPAEEKK